MKALLVFLLRILLTSFVYSQSTQPKFESLQKQFYKNYEQLKEQNKPFAEKETDEEDGTLSRFRRWEWLMQTRLMPDGTLPDPGITARERSDYLALHPDEASIRNANWTQVGTLSGTIAGAGRINVIQIDPTNTNVIYIGTACGGIWKTTNGGTSWTAVGDNLPNLSIADIALDPNNSSNIYVATGDGYGYTSGSDQDFWGGLYSAGVFKSVDGGATWNTTGLSYNQSDYNIINRLLINPSDTSTVVAAGKNGIMRSTNGGISWTQTLSGWFFDMEYNPSNSSIVYCAGLASGQSYSAIYKSTDGGATWSTIKSNFAAGLSRISIEVSAANSQIIYALNTAGTFIKSTDEGATWTTMTYPSSASFYGYYDCALACSAADANFVVVGGMNMMKSTNGGSSWSSISGTHSDQHCFAFLPTSSSTFYSGNDGGFYKTTNSGSTWTNLSSGLMISQIYRVASSATNPNIVYSGWQDNGTRRWNGDNSTWSSVLGGDGMDCMVDYTNANVAYATSQNGSLYRTTTGTSFSSIPLPSTGNWVTPIRMHPTTPTTIYAGTASVYKSTNSGLSNSWVNIGNNIFDVTTCSGDKGCSDIAISPSDPNTIYACSFRKILRTTDGGTTWTNITTGLPSLVNLGINQIAVSASDPNTIWICLGGYSSGNKVFRSTDGGGTWTNISGTLANIPVNTIVYEKNSPDRVYIGTDIGIYYIDNNSTNWISYSDGLPNVLVLELEINYTSNKLVAATYGRGMWQSDLSSVVVTNQSIISLSGNLNFGNIAIGNSSQQTLTISNTGNIGLNISSISYPSGFSGDWSGSLAGGSSHNVTVTFSPPAIQGYGGPVIIISDASTGTNTTTCSGQGTSNVSITTSAISPTSICPGSSLNVSFTANGTFNSGNIYTAQLSNATGSFSSPVTIGTLSSAQSGTIACTSPSNQTGTGFRIRVISSDPAITGTDNGSNLNISCSLPANPSASNVTANSATVSWTNNSCAISYEVDYKKNGNGPWSIISGVTGNSINITGLNSNTTYQYKVQATCVSNPLTTSGFTSTQTFKTASKKGADGIAPEVSIYPNPSRGNFVVSSSDVLKSIVVFDVLGQEIWKSDEMDENTPAEIQLKVPAGIYFVKVYGTDGMVTKQITVE